jgi:hypothetical protein
MTNKFSLISLLFGVFFLFGADLCAGNVVNAYGSLPDKKGYEACDRMSAEEIAELNRESRKACNNVTKSSKNDTQWLTTKNIHIKIR